MAAPTAPKVCPWCGTTVDFEAHEHEPRYAALAAEARARGEEPPPLPERVQQVLAGDAYIGVCPECRTIAHVVGHRPPHAGA